MMPSTKKKKEKKDCNCLSLLDMKKNGRYGPFRWSNALSSLKTGTQTEKGKMDRDKVMWSVGAMAAQRMRNRKITTYNGNIKFF